MIERLALVPFAPDATQLPGSATFTNLANGIGGWALIAAVVGVVIGGIMWAFGHYSHNFQQAYSGRKGVLVSGLAALLVGAAPRIIDFFLNAGTNLR